MADKMNQLDISIRDADAIKTMKLYTHVDRIKTELVSRNMTSPMDPIALSEIDSMHYLGNTAIQAAVDILSLDSNSRVLDVGSGFGGVSRMLSKLSECQVTALELQQDIHELGQDLTKRCNISERVKHVNGDILDGTTEKMLGDELFHVIVSYLVFLHIPNKNALFDVCSRLLKSDGSMFIEDFYCKASFTNLELESLAKDVFSKDLPSREQYISQLEMFGFHDVQFIDMTSQWTSYVTTRLDQFVVAKESFVTIHGEDAYSGLLHFYNAVATLFNGGNLGGVRLIAKKR